MTRGRLSSKNVWTGSRPQRISLLLSLCLLAGPARAQTRDMTPLGSSSLEMAASFATAEPAAAVEPAPDFARDLVASPAPARLRPPALRPMYASYVALQVLDVDSTIRAIGAGGHESNPLLRGVADVPVALLGLKAAVGVATVLATERLWRRNPLAAIAAMVAINSTYAVVVAHNYGVAAKAP